MFIQFNRQKKKGYDSQVLKKSQVTSYTIITLNKHKRIIKKPYPKGCFPTTTFLVFPVHMINHDVLN